MPGDPARGHAPHPRETRPGIDVDHPETPVLVHDGVAAINLKAQGARRRRDRPAQLDDGERTPPGLARVVIEPFKPASRADAVEFHEVALDVALEDEFRYLAGCEGAPDVFRLGERRRENDVSSPDGVMDVAALDPESFGS